MPGMQSSMQADTQTYKIKNKSWAEEMACMLKLHFSLPRGLKFNS